MDLLQANGADVHLVHPLGLHWDTRRVKNDIKDSTELANRLRRGDLPESYIAPPEQENCESSCVTGRSSQLFAPRPRPRYTL